MDIAILKSVNAEMRLHVKRLKETWELRRGTMTEDEKKERLDLSMLPIRMLMNDLVDKWKEMQKADPPTREMYEIFDSCKAAQNIGDYDTAKTKQIELITWILNRRDDIAKVLG